MRAVNLCRHFQILQEEDSTNYECKGGSGSTDALSFRYLSEGVDTPTHYGNAYMCNSMWGNKLTSVWLLHAVSTILGNFTSHSWEWQLSTRTK